MSTAEKLNEDLAEVRDHGDRSAFLRLFEHFAPLIKRYGVSTQPRLSDAQADELVQEVMIKVWTKATAFNSQKASASTWIFTIARNARIDLLRKTRHGELPYEIAELYLEEASDVDEPLLHLQQVRDAKTVREALDNIGWEQAEVMGKVYMEGKTHQQVADETGLSLGTVKSRIRLALKKMSIRFDH